MKTLTIETAIINACIELYGDASHATLNTIKRACREKGMGYDKFIGVNGADLTKIKWIGVRAVPAILKGIKMWKESKKGANTEETVQIKGDELIDGDTAICQMEKETLRQENLKSVQGYITEGMSEMDMTILMMEVECATDRGMTHNEYMHSVFLGEQKQQDEEDRLVEELKEATGTDAGTTAITALVDEDAEVHKEDIDKAIESIDNGDEEAELEEALTYLHEDARNNGISIESQIAVDNGQATLEEEQAEATAQEEECKEAILSIQEVTEEEVTTQEYLIMITKGSTTKYYQDIVRNTMTGPRLLTSLLARHAKTSSNLEAIKARAVTLRDKLSAMGMGVHIRACTVRSGRVIAHS